MVLVQGRRWERRQDLQGSWKVKVAIGKAPEPEVEILADASERDLGHI